MVYATLVVLEALIDIRDALITSNEVWFNPKQGERNVKEGEVSRNGKGVR